MLSKKRLFCRLACGTLALSCLLNLAACRAEPDAPSSDSSVRLVIEPCQRTVSYSDARREAATTRITTLAADFLEQTRGLRLNGELLQTLAKRVRAQILPLFESLAIDETEYEALLGALENRVRSDGEDFGTLTLAFRLYKDASAVLGVGRSGELVYRLSQIWLADRAEQCEARYEKYGYSWYLEDAERLRALQTDMETELDAEQFAEMTEIAAWFCSLADLRGGISELSDGALLTSDELALLVRQLGSSYAAAGESPTQWQISARLVRELSESATGKTALQSVLLILSQNGFFTELAGLMPKLLELYAALVGHMSGAELSVLCSDTAAPSERLAVLCRALTDCAENAAAVDAGLRRFAPWDSADAEKVLERAGLQSAYADFLERYPAGDLSSLLAAARGADADAQASAMWSYLRGVCPTAAFLLFREWG
ncbi:MAG TPA: hypothetical protein DDW30_06880 [Clostridiales bacterium]|nr:hypothetical protein [Clostridiales bacterium]